MVAICPSVYDESVCYRRGCALVHTVYRCGACRAPFASQTACTQHELSPTHPSNTVYRCSLCDALCTSRIVYESHVRGRRHQGKLATAASQIPVQPVQMQVPLNHTPCDICNTFVPDKMWSSHTKGNRHRTLTAGQTLSTKVDKTEVDKYNIKIDLSSINFGVIEGSYNTVTAAETVKIVNNGSITVVLAGARLTSNKANNVFSINDATRRRQLNFTSGTSVIVKLTASRADRGLFENRLELLFEIPTQRKQFTITRTITARVGSKADYETLKATEPYVRPKRRQRRRITKFHNGVRPQNLASIDWVRRLEEYPEPFGLEDLAFREDLKTFEKVKIVRSSFMSGAFGVDTYSIHMQTMLWIEEEQARRELAEYDIEHAELVPDGSFFELRIRGLAEKRPSVIVGDRIFASMPGSSEIPFAGHVHIVKDKSVLLRFNKKFKPVSGRKYAIHFDLNRLVFRRMHQAMTCETLHSRISFPSASQELRAITTNMLKMVKPFDAKIANNDPQHRAVASILRMPPGSNPFIVFGPPGTGKTVTIVEAIRQIIATKPNARVLACAPSNSAADIIAERLSAIGNKALIRIIAPSRARGAISQAVLEFTHVNEHGVFICPPREELEAFRVVVSTCCNASVPYGIGVEPGHFSHVFVDEAAQATEPEVMMPVRTMLGPSTNVILSGDIKQLGPIVRSAVARELGLKVSLLERLMSTTLYNEDTAKGKSMIKLTKNYRSHPAILSFPNEKFYKNELQACADRAISHCISGRWSGLVRKDFPVIFHGVCGQDEREDPSPSYFNADEVSIVRDYVKSLLNDKTLRLNPEDIGVITPYRAQVKKIRQLMGTFAKETRVGSVEEYQGQEKRVIIISTVRSSPDMISFDLRHTLGFVANPRRFNVAVTRAQALLIVVGDPYVLALDPLWKQFINYVHIGGGYTGQGIDWDPSEPVDDSARLDEARRAQGLTELEELILRTSELDLNDSDVEDPGAFREDE